MDLPKDKLLTFCIPTYNRRKLLQETLQSIFSEIEKSSNREELASCIHLVVSDNCSTDDTEEYIRSLSCNYLTYHRFPKEVPCGENLMKVVSLASSTYCWLLTDDDALSPGAIKKVVPLLKSLDLTGISVNARGYDSLLEKRKRIEKPHDMKTNFLFLDAEDCYEKLGGWFGFWSAQIIRKKDWEMSLGGEEPFLGYHHLYLITKMLKNSPRWLYLHDELVYYRADNESFSKEYGLMKRLEIDLKTYKTIGALFFGKKSRAKKSVFETIVRKNLFHQLIGIKLKKSSFSFLLKIFWFVTKNAYETSGYWKRILPLFFTPVFVLKFFRRRYRCKSF